MVFRNNIIVLLLLLFTCFISYLKWVNESERLSVVILTIRFGITTKPTTTIMDHEVSNELARNGTIGFKVNATKEIQDIHDNAKSFNNETKSIETTRTEMPSSHEVRREINAISGNSSNSVTVEIVNTSSNTNTSFPAVVRQNNLTKLVSNMTSNNNTVSNVSLQNTTNQHVQQQATPTSSKNTTSPNKQDSVSAWINRLNSYPSILISPQPSFPKQDPPAEIPQPITYYPWSDAVESMDSRK